MAATLTPGMRAVSIPISIASIAGGFILPNDRVDLMLTSQTADGGKQLPRHDDPAQRARARDRPGSSTSRTRTRSRSPTRRPRRSSSRPQQAERVTRAQASGTLSLSLRSLVEQRAGRPRPRRRGAREIQRQRRLRRERRSVRHPLRRACTPMPRPRGNRAMSKRVLLAVLAAPASVSAASSTFAAECAPTTPMRASSTSRSHDRLALQPPHHAGARARRPSSSSTPMRATCWSPTPRSSTPWCARRAASSCWRMKTGQTNAFFFDGAGHQILSLDIRVEKDTGDLAPMIHANMPGLEHQGLRRSTTTSCSPARSTARRNSTRAQDLAARFAGDPTKVVNMLKIAGGEQVMLKVRIAEMHRNIAKQFGVNLARSRDRRRRADHRLDRATSSACVGHALSDASGGAVRPGLSAHSCRSRRSSRSSHGANGQTGTLTPRLRCASPNNLQGVAAGARPDRSRPHPGRAESDGGVGRDGAVPRRRRIPGSGRPRHAGQRLDRVQAVRRRPLLHAGRAERRAASRCRSRPRSASSPTPAPSRLHGARRPIRNRRTGHDAGPDHPGAVGAPRADDGRAAVRRQLRDRRPDAAHDQAGARGSSPASEHAGSRRAVPQPRLPEQRDRAGRDRQRLSRQSDDRSQARRADRRLSDPRPIRRRSCSAGSTPSTSTTRARPPSRIRRRPSATSCNRRNVHAPTRKTSCASPRWRRCCSREAAPRRSNDGNRPVDRSDGQPSDHGRARLSLAQACRSRRPMPG